MHQVKTSRPLVIAAVMASLCMIAIESTIVATAMPQIVGDLGGLRFYSWVFATFLLAQTAMTVVFGKLSDIYGRKPMILAGIAIFLAGTVAAGFAWSMPAMIAFRLIQGVGAGAIQPVSMTIVADLYPAHERGKIQGYLASVWAVAAVIGPVLGAFIIRQLSWAWIFWMNIPVAILAVTCFVLFFNERREPKSASIDFAGAATFTVAMAALMVALTDAGDGDAQRAVIAAVVFCVFAALFVWVERRAADPVISFELWGRRAIAAANAAMLVSCMVTMGLTTFLPMFVQGVMHRTPVAAGLALTMVLVGWPVGSTIAARIFTRVGLRQLMIFGSVLLPIGISLLLLLDPESPVALAGLSSLVAGFGMGFMGVAALVMIQEIVGVHERGSATASNLFARNLGNTVGATLLGAVFNHGLATAANGVVVTSEQIKQLLAAAAQGARPEAAVEAVMRDSLHLVFVTMGVLSLLAILCTTRAPAIRITRGKPVAKEATSSMH